MPNFYGAGSTYGGTNPSGTTQKYSPARDFYSQNLTYSGATGLPQGAFSNIGKFNASVLGVSPDARTPEQQQFEATAQQHPLDAIGIGHIPVLGDILKFGTNLITNMPDISPPGLVRGATSLAIWNLNADNPDRRKYEQSIKAGWEDAGHAQAEFMRAWFQKNTPVPLLADYLTPAQNIGEGVLKTISLLGLPQQAFQRGFLRATNSPEGQQRLKTLDLATDEQLQNKPDLMQIRDEHKNNKITDDQALDQLSSAGFLMSNPTDPFTSAMQEIFTDPVTLLSFGTAGLARWSTKGGAQLTAHVLTELGRDGAKAAIERFAAGGGRDIAANMGQDFIREVLTNPETSEAAQRAINKAGRSTRFWTGTGTTEPGAAAEMERLVTQRLAAPTIVKYGRWAERALDPFTLFGSDDAAKGSEAVLARAMTEGAVHSTYGHGTVRALQLVTDKVAGGDALAQLDNYIGRAAMQTVAQVGLEGYVRQALRTGAKFNPLDNPTDLAMQASRMFGSDVSRYVRDKVESVMFRVIPKGGETMEQALASAAGRARQQLRQMLNITEDQAAQMMEGQGEKFISLIDYAHFGYATKGFIASMRRVPEKFSSLTFLGPRQITRKTLKEFKDAVKNREMTTVRAMVRQYDALYFNLALDVKDEDLLHAAGELADGLAKKVPNEVVDVANLPASVRRWATENPGYKLAYKPKDVWGAVMSKDNRMIGMNPWVDWVDDATAPVRLGAFKTKWAQAMQPIASSSINRRAMHRFSARMGAQYGMDEATSQRIYWAVSSRAETNGVTVRGLRYHDFYKAAEEVRMPKAMRNKLTQRDMAEAIIWAYEGELNQVGVTQKLTGVVKTKLAPFGNAAGMIAERLYPLVRFEKNPWFQLTELVETPILLAGRGIWPGTSKHLLNAKTQYVRAMLAMSGNGTYKGDMMEFSDLVFAANDMAGRVFNTRTRLGRMLGTVSSVHGVKKAGENAMFRHEMGRFMVAEMKREAPTQFDAIVEWNRIRSLYNTVNDGDTAIHMLFDAYARADPEGALRAVDPTGQHGLRTVFGEHGPGAVRPHHIGDRPRVETGLVRYIALGSGWQDTTWKQLRRRLRDPADTEMSMDRLSEDLRNAGADEDYINRVTAMVVNPTPKEFYKAIEATGFPKEQVAAMEAWAQKLARDAGLTDEEFMSRVFADVPQTIDAQGYNRGRSLFQRLVAAHQARGIEVPTIDGPEVRAVRDLGNEIMPTFEHRPDVPVNELTSLEKKHRRWENSHDARVADTTDTLGSSVPLTDTTGQPIVFMRGQHQSGPVTPHEWRQMLERTMTGDQIREAADWYREMRQAFIAQYNGDTDAATRAILGFALTQKNTSPAMGMSHLFAALEKVRRGERLPIDKKFDGLATEELKRLLEDDMMTDSGLAQKLTDFLDSLLGNEHRTVGIGRAEGWMPAAIDIWAKRDLGFLDHSIKTSHWKEITGAASVKKVKRPLYKRDGTAITRLNKEGERVPVTTTDVVLTFDDGRVQTIPGEQLSAGQPSDLQYDYGVQRYNEIAQHLNEEKYLDRENWTAADVQAMGWFRAKIAFGDDTGTPLDAFFRNHYNVNFEVMPGEGTNWHDLYPGLVDDGRVPITHAQAKAITSDVMDTSVHEAARISGVQIIGKFGGTGTWVDAGGVANITPNVTVEVLGTDDGVRRFMAALGMMNQQNAVAASKTVVIKTRPTATNGMRWAYDWPLPQGISKEAADELHLELIAHDMHVAQGSSLIRYDSGQYAVRAVWNPEAGVPHWLESELESAVPAGERMSLTYTGPMYSYSDEGYRRGRFVDQAELDETQAWGQRIVERLDNAPTDELVPLDEAMITDIMSRVRETPWNGVTYNLRRAAGPEALPPLPGETPVPKGMIRAYHYTSSSEDPSAVLGLVREGGLKRQAARGETYGEPNQIWFSASKPDNSHNFVEVHLWPWEITGTGSPPAHLVQWDFSVDPPRVKPREGSEEALAAWAQSKMDRGDNFATTIDVPPDRIVTYNEPWMHEYRELVKRAPTNRDEFQQQFGRFTEGHWVGTSTGDAVSRRLAELGVGPPVGPLPKGKPGKGPYITGAGITTTVPFSTVTEAKFRAALEEFVAANREELSKRGRYLGVFRNEDTGLFEFDVAYATFDEDEAEALQLALKREGGAYDTFSGNGVYAPTLRPDTVPVTEPTVIQPVRQRVYSHYIEEGDYASEIHGAGRRGAGPPSPSAEFVVSDGKRRVGASVERAYRTHAGYETQAFRAERLAAGDERYTQRIADLPDVGAEQPPTRLFQRGPRGVRAAVEFDTALPGIGRNPGRATLHVRPGRNARDTLLHEFAHAFSGQLDDSAKRLYLNSYNRRFGRAVPTPAPGNGARRVGRRIQWDENVHEQFANDVVEYFRTGQPVEAELQPLFDYYGKYLRASRNRPGLDDQTKALLDQIVGTNTFKGGVPYNAGEKALLDIAYGRARRAERTMTDLIYFKGERSWAERSLNHPYFGLYPMSYMWGKVLPELIEFLAFRPFGLKAPMGMLNLTQKVFQSVMTQEEHDPEMRKWMDDNEPYLRAIAGLVPGLPWELPVNAPLWMRYLIQDLEENSYREQAGLKHKDPIDLLHNFFAKDVPKSLDSLNPLGSQGLGRGIEAISGVAGLASQALGAGFNAIVPPPAPEENRFAGEDAQSFSPQGAERQDSVPTTLEQAVARGASTLIDPAVVEQQLTDELLPAE